MLPRHIDTERLRLRPFQPSDRDDVFAYASDPQWGTYLPVPRPYQRSDAEQYVASLAEIKWIRKAVWAIVFEDAVVGAFDLRVSRLGHRAEIGYAIARRMWRRGLTTEAARAVIDVAFSSCPDLVRIEAYCDVRNVASARLMERLGMRHEGILRRAGFCNGTTYDEIVASLLRGDWRPCNPL